LSSALTVIIASLTLTALIKRPRLFLALQTDLKVPSGHYIKVRVLSALTAIIASLTRTTPVERPFRFIFGFADDASPAT
jgi:hypothetical protein